MTAPKPGPSLPRAGACTGYLPHIDADGFRWKVWCIGISGHAGPCTHLGGWHFEPQENSDDA